MGYEWLLTTLRGFSPLQKWTPPFRKASLLLKTNSFSQKRFPSLKNTSLLIEGFSSPKQATLPSRTSPFLQNASPLSRMLPPLRTPSVVDKPTICRPFKQLVYLIGPDQRLSISRPTNLHLSVGLARLPGRDREAMEALEALLIGGRMWR